MNKILVVLMVFAALFAVPHSDAVSVEIAPKVWSQYLNDNGAILHDKSVLHNDMTVLTPYGLYVDIFSSFGLESADLCNNYGDELDYILGWAGEVYGFGVDTSLIYFDLFETCNIPSKDDFIEWTIKLSRDFAVSDAHKITPYIGTKTLFAADKEGADGGVYLYGGAKHTWTISKMWAMVHDLYILHDSGAIGFARGVIGQYCLRVNLAISDSFELNPFLVKFGARIQDAKDRHSESLIGTGFTFRF